MCSFVFCGMKSASETMSSNVSSLFLSIASPSMITDEFFRILFFSYSCLNNSEPKFFALSFSSTLGLGVRKKAATPRGPGFFAGLRTFASTRLFMCLANIRSSKMFVLNDLIFLAKKRKSSHCAECSRNDLLQHPKSNL